VNRRSFLSLMGFVAPAVIVKPTYFFAPPGGWGVKLYATIGAWADYANFQFYNDPPIATIFDPCATGLPHLPIDYESVFDPELRVLSMKLACRMAKTIDAIIAGETFNRMEDANDDRH
jgi:hypothetical protein